MEPAGSSSASSSNSPREDEADIVEIEPQGTPARRKRRREPTGGSSAGAAAVSGATATDAINLSDDETVDVEVEFVSERIGPRPARGPRPSPRPVSRPGSRSSARPSPRPKPESPERRKRRRDDKDAPTVITDADSRGGDFAAPDADGPDGGADVASDDVQAIKELPVESSTKLSDFTCVICFDSPEMVAATPCGHLYCYECVYRALSASSHANAKGGECSVCRTRVLYKNVVVLEMRVG
ncbi:uncharacterized protein V1510DRAFT_422273 [Dipodascopsis tothii]|uniref:uncharacterized protein n=1 Tax=Dipodascopsis tothii TaxID=44089 RepID=UPI0034CF32F0